MSKRFDVAIVETISMKVETVVRTDCTQERADKSCDIWERQINDNFTVAILPAGKYVAGDVVDEPDDEEEE
jgi:hypothetical protein